MKKFDFRLESLLNLRTHKAKTAREELIRAVGLRLAKEEEIRQSEEYLGELLSEKPACGRAEVLQTKYHHRKFVENQIEKMNVEKQRLLEIENIKRNALNEAMKEEKILTKLKEKKLEDHKREALREETAILDEIGGTRGYKSRTNSN